MRLTKETKRTIEHSRVSAQTNDTLWETYAWVSKTSLTGAEDWRKDTETYHFKRPDSSNPDLQFALDAFDVGELNAFPPASSCGFPPEEQQLLRHTDSVSGRLTLDVSP